MPDFAYIRKELLRNGVNKKLLWTEYMETCRLNGDSPLMYSQFCYHIQQDEQKHHASIAGADYSSGRKLNRDLIHRLATCEYIMEQRNIFVTGASGSGKSYLPCAFGM